ncbi:MAG: ABC transporter permease [Marinilabiliaceae bacterium]|nr:ABC transporter permease [Marinilabiliaceae bacterium]
MRHFKRFIRHFRKQKTIGFLSIGSLSIGLTATVLIGIWCLNELSFDNFHYQPDTIYRITRKGLINNQTEFIGSVFGPLGPGIQTEMPEIEDMVRLFYMDGIMRSDQAKRIESKVIAVDSTFFNFFKFELKEGALHNFFSKPNSILITQELANLYFPGKNPIGEILAYQGKHEVVGILKDIPVNSTLQFNAITTIESVAWIKNNKWGQRDGFSTFVRLGKNTHLKELAQKITQYAHSQWYHKTEGFNVDHQLQPLKDMHFSNEYLFDFFPKGNKKILLTFISLGLILLIIGSINFINLFISTLFLRAKSVGVKKTNGATNTHVIFDFIIETTFYVSIAIISGLFLAELFLPHFNTWVGYKLQINYNDPQLYVILITLFVLTVLLSGTFPAIYMTRFSPTKTLKGQFKGKKTSILQKSLVIFQFSASVILIISVITIKKQISFIQNTDLGFENKNIINVYTSENIGKKYDRIRETLISNPDVTNVTAKLGTPLQWNRGYSILLKDKRDQSCTMEICTVKPNYFEVMNLPFVTGQNPFGTAASHNYCVINERAAFLLGLSNPMNVPVVMGNNTFIIKGVLKDAYLKSLHAGVEPQFYIEMSERYTHLAMMIKTTDHPESVITQVRDIWNEEETDQPFDYFFLEDAYNDLYQSENRAESIVSWSMIIALIITIAGMVGIVHYATERRTKEIGVRKVNGASEKEIMWLLILDFMKWTGIAFLIAAPVAWYIMNQWLTDFALRTDISWWIFLLAGCITSILSLLCVSRQTWIAANQNPVNCLRYE